MIDDSTKWGRDDDVKKFLATESMQVVKRKDPESIAYFVTAFQERAKPEDVLEQHRDWYEAAMKEYES
jgi:hypothetical protein